MESYQRLYRQQSQYRIRNNINSEGNEKVRTHSYSRTSSTHRVLALTYSRSQQILRQPSYSLHTRPHQSKSHISHNSSNIRSHKCLNIDNNNDMCRLPMPQVDLKFQKNKIKKLTEHVQTNSTYFVNQKELLLPKFEEDKMVRGRARVTNRTRFAQLHYKYRTTSCSSTQSNTDSETSYRKCRNRRLNTPTENNNIYIKSHKLDAKVSTTKVERLRFPDVSLNLNDSREFQELMDYTTTVLGENQNDCNSTKCHAQNYFNCTNLSQTSINSVNPISLNKTDEEDRDLNNYSHNSETCSKILRSKHNTETAETQWWYHYVEPNPGICDIQELVEKKPNESSIPLQLSNQCFIGASIAQNYRFRYGGMFNPCLRILNGAMSENRIGTPIPASVNDSEKPEGATRSHSANNKKKIVPFSSLKNRLLSPYISDAMAEFGSTDSITTSDCSCFLCNSSGIRSKWECSNTNNIQPNYSYIREAHKRRELNETSSKMKDSIEAGAYSREFSQAQLINTSDMNFGYAYLHEKVEIPNIQSRTCSNHLPYKVTPLTINHPDCKSEMNKFSFVEDSEPESVITYSPRSSLPAINLSEISFSGISALTSISEPDGLLKASTPEYSDTELSACESASSFEIEKIIKDAVNSYWGESSGFTSENDFHNLMNDKKSFPDNVQLPDDLNKSSSVFVNESAPTRFDKDLEIRNKSEIKYTVHNGLINRGAQLAVAEIESNTLGHLIHNDNVLKKDSSDPIPSCSSISIDGDTCFSSYNSPEHMASYELYTNIAVMSQNKVLSNEPKKTQIIENSPHNLNWRNYFLKSTYEDEDDIPVTEGLNEDETEDIARKGHLLPGGLEKAQVVINKDTFDNYNSSVEKSITSLPEDDEQDTEMDDDENNSESESQANSNSTPVNNESKDNDTQTPEVKQSTNSKDSSFRTVSKSEGTTSIRTLSDARSSKKPNVILKKVHNLDNQNNHKTKAIHNKVSSSPNPVTTDRSTKNLKQSIDTRFHADRVKSIRGTAHVHNNTKTPVIAQLKVKETKMPGPPNKGLKTADKKLLKANSKKKSNPDMTLSANPSASAAQVVLTPDSQQMSTEIHTSSNHGFPLPRPNLVHISKLGQPLGKKNTRHVSIVLPTLKLTSQLAAQSEKSVERPSNGNTSSSKQEVVTKKSSNQKAPYGGIQLGFDADAGISTASSNPTASGLTGNILGISTNTNGLPNSSSSGGFPTILPTNEINNSPVYKMARDGETNQSNNTYKQIKSGKVQTQAPSSPTTLRNKANQKGYFGILVRQRKLVGQSNPVEHTTFGFTALQHPQELILPPPPKVLPKPAEVSPSSPFRIAITKPSQPQPDNETKANSNLVYNNNSQHITRK